MGFPPTPPPARQDAQAGLSGVNTAVGCDRRSSARGSSWPNYSTPGTGNLSRSSMFHSTDIGQIVRKWQIRFSGAMSQSIDVSWRGSRTVWSWQISQRKRYYRRYPSCLRTQQPRGTEMRRKMDHVAGLSDGSETVLRNHQKIPAAVSGRGQ